MTQEQSTVEAVAPDADLNRLKHWRMEDSTEGRHFGKEPNFDRSLPEDEQYCATLNGISWYKNMSSDAEQQAWVLEYMKANSYSQDDIDAVSLLTPQNVKVGYGVIAPKHLGMSFPGVVCRLYMRRAKPLPDWEENLSKVIQHLIKEGKKLVGRKPVGGRKRKEIVEDPIEVAAKDLFDAADTLFDRILDREQNQTKIPKDLKLNPVEWAKANVTEYKVGKRFYALLVDFAVRIDNYTDGGEPIVGYKMIERGPFEEFAKILRVFMAAVKARVQHVKTSPVIKTETGKVSRRKVKPAITQVAGVANLKADPESNIQSIEPVKVVGSKAVILYNPKAKSATYIESTPSRVLGVRGTKIVNVDSSKSYTRRLRNPAELTSMAKSNRSVKPLQKHLDGLTTKQCPAKLRISEDVMILAVS